MISSVVSVYQTLLSPIPPFTWAGLPISTLDTVAALRLCVVLRQLREMSLKSHLRKNGNGVEKKVPSTAEESSSVKNIALTLCVVYGGEAVMNPWLDESPSFVFSPVVPLMYTLFTLMVDAIPPAFVPQLSFKTEFPLSFLDGLTRSYLLCSLIPPLVVTHINEAISQSPWTLCLSSLVTANTGFFLVNLLGMLNPAGWSLVTPAELRAYGWTNADLWCAPVTTALYALLTHAQPFWADLHTLIVRFFHVTGQGIWRLPMVEAKFEKVTEAVEVQAIDKESARAVCAVFLTVLFVARTVRNMGPQFLAEMRASQRNRTVTETGSHSKKLKTKTQ